MICAHCSTPLPDDSRFCLQCGSLVSDAEGQKRASATMDASSTARMERTLKEDTKGEYEIGRQLGKGGMAAVYLATEVRLGRKVAIKVLPPELTFGHGIERFVREAKTAAALDHPNIIPIYRITSGDRIFWYAMKYIEGRSLDELIKEHQRFSPGDTADILDQAADALEYAHKKMVIHRDVKPANMMIDESGRVIVTDFGIAKALTEGTLTASGAAIGTPYYMSPEQAIGGAVSGAADQYSLGVVAYQMLSGQLPFEGESAVEILHKHTADVAPPLEVLRPGLAKYVYAAVHRALEKKPADRYPTIRAFVDGLRGVAAPAGRQRSGTMVVTPAGQGGGRASKTGDAPGVRKARSRILVAVVTLVVVGGIGGGAWLLTQDKGPAAPDSAAVRSDSPLVGNPPLVAGDSDTAQVVALAPDSAAGRDKAERAQPRPAATSGRVTIRNLPRGGRVYVDDAPRSPTGFDLSPGRHIVRMEATGFVPFVDTVFVTAGQPQRLAWVGRTGTPTSAAAPAAAPPPVAADPPAALGERGVLLLSVEPFARIEVNLVVRRTAGRILVDTLRAGQHRISLIRDGYLRVDTTVTVRAGEERRVAIQLQRTP